MQQLLMTAFDALGGVLQVCVNRDVHVAGVPQIQRYGKALTGTFDRRRHHEGADLGVDYIDSCRCRGIGLERRHNHGELLTTLTVYHGSRVNHDPIVFEPRGAARQQSRRFGSSSRFPGHYRRRTAFVCIHS